MGQLLTAYVVLTAGLTAAIALGLTITSRPLAYREAFFATLAALCASGDLLNNPDESLGYYALASIATVGGFALPLFFLGAFVFKLFRHDPVQWREAPALTDFRDFGASLVFRFYNRTTSDLAGVTVTVTARVLSAEDVPLWVNKRMDVFRGDGSVDIEAFFPLMEPGLPTNVRVLLHGSMDAAAIANSDRIPVPGYADRTQDKSLVFFVVTTTGISANTGDTFVSVHSYPARELTTAGEAQDVRISLERSARSWGGWHNFEGTEPLFIFGYGSLVNVESLGHTLEYLIPAERGPFVARLRGWQRRWNVGFETGSRPDRHYMSEAGNIWEGMIISLGLSEATDQVTPGVVFQVSSRDLWRLDLRERNYDRLDVTHQIDWPAKPPLARIFTYVPHEAAKERAFAASRLNRDRSDDWSPGVITRRYLQLVEDGYAALIHQDSQIMLEHRNSYPDHKIFDVLNLVFQLSPAAGPGAEPGEPSVTPYSEETDS